MLRRKLLKDFTIKLGRTGASISDGLFVQISLFYKLTKTSQVCGFVSIELNFFKRTVCLYVR